MIRRTLYICLSLTVLILNGCATSGRAKPGAGMNTLLKVETMEGAVELRMKEEFTSSYTIYKPSDPYTVVVELPEVGKGGVRDVIAPEEGGIAEIRFTEVRTPTRFLKMEVLLEAPLNLQPEKIGNSLLLKVVGHEAAGEGAEDAARGAAPPQAEEDLVPATEITGLSFSLSRSALKFTVRGNGTMDPEIFTLDNRVVIDVPGVSMKATVPEKVVSPVVAVRYGVYDTKVRLVLDVEKDVEFAASTAGDSIVISIPLELLRKVVVKAEDGEEAEEAARPPVEEAEVVEPEAVEPEEVAIRRRYAGKIISLDFQDADIVPIFRFIGDIAGLNVVIHPSVSGKITLKLLNVPWDQALDIILEISSLDKSVEDNILRIAPVDVFAKQKEEEARLKGVRMKAADLLQVAIPLKYIDAGEMQTRLNEAKVMSPRGTSRIDERTNTLILNDVEESLNRIIDEEVTYWDTPEHGTMQVLIEAKIVEVNSEQSRSLGIRWGGSGNQDNFSFISDASTYDVSVNTPPLASGPAVPASGGVISIGYTETVTLNLSLQALESVSKVRNLANPRILTIDKQAATIKQGVQIPFSTTSSEGTKTEFQDAVLELNVTPEIQPNGMLKLLVKAKNDTQIPVGNEIGINKQEINTQALVKDGQTLVLGGIYRNSETESEIRVPWLSRIPLLGWLFKTRSVSVSPNELLIFITPRIVK